MSTTVLVPDDSNRFRNALLAAAAFHLLVLALSPPRPRPAVVPRPPETAIFVVDEAPRPRPVEPTPSRPEQPATQTAIWIPVPEAPEPLIPFEVLPPLVLPPPEVGVVVEIPDPPPPPAAADAEGPIEVSGLVVAPRRLHAPPPVTPPLAQRLGIQGEVVLEAVIDRRGSLIDLRVVDGPGFGLEQASLAAVRGWRFAPATLDGVPVAVRWRLTVSFRRSPRSG